VEELGGGEPDGDLSGQAASMSTLRLGEEGSMSLAGMTPSRRLLPRSSVCRSSRSVRASREGNISYVVGHHLCPTPPLPAAIASLLNSNQSITAREQLDDVVNVRDTIKWKGDKNQSKDSGECKDAKKTKEKASGEHEGNFAPKLTMSERQNL
jgi:hypothetical protein